MKIVSAPKPRKSNGRAVPPRSRPMKIATPANARMPIGRLMKNTQRQEKLSVSQPPSTGPRIGPRIAPAPQIAITWPTWLGG